MANMDEMEHRQCLFVYGGVELLQYQSFQLFQESLIFASLFTQLQESVKGANILSIAYELFLRMEHYHDV